MAVLTDLGAAGVFLLICLLTVGDGVRPAVVSIVFAIALAARRSSPLVAAGLCWAAATAQLADGWSLQTADVASLGVLYAVAAYGNRVARLVGLASVFLGAGVVSVAASRTPEGDAFPLTMNPEATFAVRAGVSFFAVLVLFGFCWVVGLLTRARRIAMLNARARLLSDFERERVQDRVAVEQERTRIARDMHDVVAHSLAVVIAQADGTRYGHAGDRTVVEGSLRAISDTARSALIDVDHLLGELRSQEQSAPRPVVGDLGELSERLRAAGLDVRLEQRGSGPPLPTDNEAALYRIVQEALTNALRHGNTREPVTVVCERSPTGLSVTVTNQVRPTAVPDDTGTGPIEAARAGRGVAGMHERADRAGGRLDVTADAGSFTVRALLPASTSSADTR